MDVRRQNRLRLIYLIFEKLLTLFEKGSRHIFTQERPFQAKFCVVSETNSNRQ